MHVCSCDFRIEAMMKFAPLVLAAGALMSGAVFAQTTAPSAPTATVHAVCKDGTPFDGATLKGACRGHGGVDKKAGAPTAPGAAPSSKSAPVAATTPAVPTPSAMSNAGSAVKVPPSGAKTAPTGAKAAAPGQVWANDSTKVYHCSNDRYYGKTKQGEYMSEADAKAKGFHASHGKACAG